MRGPQPATPHPSPAGNPIPGGRFHFRASVPLLFSLLLLAAWTPPRALAFQAAVVREVVDGDTIRVRIGGRAATVRLIGIDAPERGHPSRPKEYLADEAAEALSALCAGKPVRLEKDREDVDKYGWLLRYVSSGDGRRLLNLELVRKGLARVYRRFPFSRQPEFEAAEGEARKEGLGLWRSDGRDELGWIRDRGGAPVAVWPLGGGTYGISHGGVWKAGIAPEALQPEVATVARLRVELSDADFSREARKRGFGAVGDDQGDRRAAGAAERPSAGSSAPGDRGEGTVNDPVPWDRAHEYPGREITVEGTVVRARRSGKTVFLNFHPNWKRYLTIVLFTGKVPGLPDAPETAFLDRKVRVRGPVARYKDRMEIVIGDAADLQIVP
jgi:micrococcal nuclease